MSNLLPKRTVFLLLITGVLALSGCVSMGPSFKKTEVVPDDMGLVYIYWHSDINNGVNQFYVMEDDTVVTQLAIGGYYPYFMKPGKHKLWTKSKSLSPAASGSVTLDVTGGKTYYVRGIYTGFTIFTVQETLLLVIPDEAITEISKCKLIPAQKN